VLSTISTFISPALSFISTDLSSNSEITKSMLSIRYVQLSPICHVGIYATVDSTGSALFSSSSSVAKPPNPPSLILGSPSRATPSAVFLYVISLSTGHVVT
jgi:hypothetical protein